PIYPGQRVELENERAHYTKVPSPAPHRPELVAATLWMIVLGIITWRRSPEIAGEAAIVVPSD
ncbi:MAG: hypothetical protein ACRDVK_07185, partial [Acidimicrobiia bacterium]